MSFTEIEIIYPKANRRKVGWSLFTKIAKLVMLVGAISCIIVNLAIGGKAWSVVVIASIYTAYTLLISPDLVEYNRISQFIKLVTCSCILLTLIDLLLVSGWAVNVVPMVCFGGLIVSGVLFFTDIERQKQNMKPMLILIFLSLVGAGVGLGVFKQDSHWSLIVLGGVAVILLVACLVTLGKDFFRELKRRFHTR